MKVNQDQINTRIQQQLDPIYLIAGDEPLLIQEICDNLRAACQQQGITERELMHAEAGFDWGHLLQEANAMSLFSSRRLIEVRIPNGKPSDKGAALLELAQQPNPDNVLLVVCPRLDAGTQKTKWVKAIEKSGVFTPVWPIDRKQLPGWLQRRLQQAGLSATPEAVAHLAHRVEGNLLAAVQEIEKLRLMGETHLTAEIIDDAIGDSSRYDAFTLADACLHGNFKDAYNVLHHLQSEGNEPIMLLGALTMKVRQLANLKAVPSGKINDAFKQNNIWPKQQAPFKAALSRLSLEEVYGCIKLLESIDRAIKGDGEDPWLLLNQLIEQLSGRQLLLSS